jgi:hypothetical protein
MDKIPQNTWAELIISGREELVIGMFIINLLQQKK